MLCFPSSSDPFHTRQSALFTDKQHSLPWQRHTANFKLLEKTIKTRKIEEILPALVSLIPETH